jgi:hypothetical protein
MNKPNSYFDPLSTRSKYGKEFGTPTWLYNSHNMSGGKGSAGMEYIITFSRKFSSAALDPRNGPRPQIFVADRFSTC